jgi:hypothetical protein
VRHGEVVTKHGVEFWCEKQKQICLSYNSLPNVLNMSLDEIDYFYQGIIGDLIKYTKQG